MTTRKSAKLKTKKPPSRKPKTPSRPKAKPASKPEKSVTPKSTAEKSGKEQWVKVGRDSFTMPHNEYQKIAEIKEICLQSNMHVKKARYCVSA